VPLHCLFLCCRQLIFAAALQHSMMYSGFCATERLCGKNAEPV